MNRSAIVIVDDHAVVRLGLRTLLERSGEFRIAGEAASAAEARKLLAAEQPEFALMDLMLSGAGGPDLVAECVRLAPKTQFLILSQHDEMRYAERVLRAGARGYVMKGDDLGEVLAALAQIQRGEIAVSSRVRTFLLERSFAKAQPSEPSIAGSLSEREIQVFRLIGEGYKTGAIAKELNLSSKTVGAHRENIKQKLGIRSSAELERAAVIYVETGG